ncbi:glycerol-3-phosphate dehydrogenase [NAD+] 1 [Microbotryum lychnidis-dioicae p1A1 Lamole]|uniref:Glycerol-3-phosphate dehydrogenase [NAD(+)] n=1 Tax=Microbotryum lychnidis-dioicae (strain p1A1 Lamole / MvSl-1064) TaxID=683840 RepID=U5HBV8_USTV1|nr:glycerol-3-phosphate dehydrogenase [NAD+] 1 [Microbotryum lychnidis-dioicae p1A1 Lamole]|eukprot:KDE04892.1 glycerol-3-phosphate dehydrogenase [NAD+] 1 [Microbotryum lychnidis-dioicae p1A1 Lamole]
MAFPLTSPAPPGGKWKIAIIGSGNWGSAIARLIGINVQAKPQLFDPEVKMWVFEEQFKGRSLVQQFNESHENVKYLPGIKIPHCVVAEADLVRSVQGANALVFVTPHAFVPGVCKQLRGKIDPNCRALSLVKGVEVSAEHISIFAQVIEEQLGIPCGALSGANIADEVARDAFGETTIACKDQQEGQRWYEAFHTPTFHVQITDDVVGVSLAGALKNIVAIAAGACDGLGWGNNAKAAIMRIGLLEMRKFALEFFDTARPETFVYSSAGIADLITSCLGGRNRKCGEAFVKTGKSFDVLEREMLNGQKLQGVQTAKEVHEFLKARGRIDSYPLFHAVYNIAYEGLPPAKLTAHL